MNVELTGREWRKIWEQLYNRGDINLSGRISHDLGHAWNSDEWESKFTLDFDNSDLRAIRNAAGDAGLDVTW